MAEPQPLQPINQSRAPLSAWLGVVLLFVLFGGIVLAVVGPSPRRDNYEQGRVKKRTDALKTVRDEEKELTTYGWIDKTKGIARIPIDRAVELTLADLKTKKPTAAGPIATPVPSAAPPNAPAAGTATAASQSPTATVKPSDTTSAPSASGTPKPTSVAGPNSENRGQPAAATNPAPAKPGTQPGPNVTPAASPTASTAKPAVSPSPNVSAAASSPLPVRGKESPSQSPSPH
jgi:hypothetical protein